MAFPTLGRKHPHFILHKEQPLLCKKKCLTYWSDRTLRHDKLTTGCDYSCTSHTCVNKRTKYLTDTTRLFEQTLFWSDAQNASQKVFEHLKSGGAIGDIFLGDSASHKFSAFRRDITEECGAEDKQHSWAVIEKREELIMYGPYYPNYINGEHSEDIIIRQTQELLSSGDVPEDWKVYVFTMNSPCLARNTDSCMLSLIHKAWEWWSVFGVKTHIGFVRSWGFKGNKENLFKEVDYKQTKCIIQSVDYENYIKVADKIADLNLLCEDVFWVAKSMLGSEKENFPMMTAEQKQDRRSFFRGMNTVFEGKQEEEEEEKLLRKELNAMLDAAESLLSEQPARFEEHLAKGEVFLLSHTFSSQVFETLQEDLRVRFQQCWREIVQDRYAESVREKLTEAFNQCTVQLFLKDILTFTGQYLQIGKLQLQNEAFKAV
ncbi:uncharacterized protein LOC108240064 isoform X2 [Kryptolebias marmoratus]|uniref:uncharacterized protein LOC108240064 isoform X2 n=1 Tax=Kryptolebias marmoratus TaxID=37003 RepID=UPI0007F88D2F|nr:uncharacterized protein LOC108240064 isoform X2 [Kryptolebias marmoratus]